MRLLVLNGSGTGRAFRTDGGDVAFEVMSGVGFLNFQALESGSWTTIRKSWVDSAAKINLGGTQSRVWRVVASTVSTDFLVYTDDAEPAGQDVALTIDATQYGVIGDGSTECYDALSAAIAAAQDAMENYGLPATILLPPGDIKITNTAPLDFTHGFSFRLGDSAASPVNAMVIPSMRGAGKMATRLRPQTAGQALFRIYSDTAGVFIDNFEWRDFAIFGPGQTNASTVGIQIGGVSTGRSDISGNATFRNMLIRDCGTGIRLDDATNDLFEHLYLSRCGYGIELGYNIDNCTFMQCQFQGNFAAPTNTGVGMACGTWTPPYNTASGSGNSTIFLNCLWSFLTNCMDWQVVDQSNILVLGGYSERVNKFAYLGPSAGQSGIKQFIMDGHHFSQASTATYGLTSAAIEVRGTGGAVDPHICIQNCRSDTTPTQQWVLGATQAVGAGTGHLVWRNNLLNSSHANGSVTWADANVTVPASGQGELEIGKANLQYNANTPLGSTPMYEWRLRQGIAGRTYAKWTPVDSSNAQAGSHIAIENLDAAGASQIVALKGAIIPQGQNSVSRPSASSTYRGMLWVTFGAGGVTDSVDICLKAAADTYSWRQILTGG